MSLKVFISSFFAKKFLVSCKNQQLFVLVMVALCSWLTPKSRLARRIYCVTSYSGLYWAVYDNKLFSTVHDMV